MLSMSVLNAKEIKCTKQFVVYGVVIILNEILNGNAVNKFEKGDYAVVSRAIDNDEFLMRVFK